MYVTGVCLFQEVIVRDSSSGWDLGPDLDHFSSRTRQVLQYMNPNKINMDLLVELIAYLGTARRHACFKQRMFIRVLVSFIFCFLCSARQITTICGGGRSRSCVPPRSGSHPAAL